jgi:hypothetical protein
LLSGRTPASLCSSCGVRACPFGCPTVARRLTFTGWSARLPARCRVGRPASGTRAGWTRTGVPPGARGELWHRGVTGRPLTVRDHRTAAGAGCGRRLRVPPGARGSPGGAAKPRRQGAPGGRGGGAGRRGQPALPGLPVGGLRAAGGRRAAGRRLACAAEGLPSRSQGLPHAAVAGLGGGRLCRVPGPAAASGGWRAAGGRRAAAGRWAGGGGRPTGGGRPVGDGRRTADGGGRRTAGGRPPGGRRSHGFCPLAHPPVGDCTETAITQRFASTRRHPPGRVHGNRRLMTLRVHSPGYPCATAQKPAFQRGPAGAAAPPGASAGRFAGDAGLHRGPRGAAAPWGHRTPADGAGPPGRPQAPPAGGGRRPGLPAGDGTTVSVHSRTPRWATAQKPLLRNGSRPLAGTPPGECTETGA